MLLKTEGESVALAHRIQESAGHRCDFRSNAVTRQQDDAMLTHGISEMQVQPARLLRRLGLGLQGADLLLQFPQLFVQIGKFGERC